MFKTLTPRWLFIIIIIASVFRFIALGRAPDGLLTEEVATAQRALEIPRATVSSSDLLHTYLTALSIRVFGENPIGIRFPATVAGLATVLITYLWGKQSISKRVGLIAAGFIAVSFWPIYFSRVALSTTYVPLFAALTGWLYAKGLSQPEKLGSIVIAASGASLGLSLYAASSAVGLVFAFVLLYIALSLTNRLLLTELWQKHLIFWGGALIVGAPAIYSYVISGWVGFTGWIGQPVLSSIRTIGLMWTHKGDSLFHYNVSQYPVFNILLGSIFLLGFLNSSLFSIKADKDEPAISLVIPLTVIGGSITAFLIDPEHAFRSASATLPATYLILAAGVDLIVKLTAEAMTFNRYRINAGIGLILLIVLTGIETAWTYFVIAPANLLARQDYHLDLAAIGKDLQSSGYQGGAAISNSDPSAPQIFAFTPHGNQSVRWFDPQSSLVIPASDKQSILYFPAGNLPGDRLAKQYFDLFSPPLVMTYSNGVLSYEKFELPSSDQFLIQYPIPQKQGVWITEITTFPPDDPEHLRVQATLPVRFGEAVELVGYQAQTNELPGETLPLLLVFRVLKNSTGHETWSLFAHLLTAEGLVAAQRDGLAAPGAFWRKGDIIILAQDIFVDTVSPGLYHLQIGLYDYVTNQRLPVMMNNQPVGDRLLLEPVTIRAP
jgi:hypothetical protein